MYITDITRSRTQRTDAHTVYKSWSVSVEKYYLNELNDENITSSMLTHNKNSDFTADIELSVLSENLS